MNSEESIVDEIGNICNQADTQFNKVLDTMENDEPVASARKRTARYLKGGLAYISTYRKKYGRDDRS